MREPLCCWCPAPATALPPALASAPASAQLWLRVGRPEGRLGGVAVVTAGPATGPCALLSRTPRAVWSSGLDCAAGCAEIGCFFHPSKAMAARGLPLLLCLWLHAATLPRPCCARKMSFSNAEPRRTAAGAIVDSHSNVVLEINGTFFLYGEWHANGHDEHSDSPVPKLSVYTSSDMATWTFRGLLHNNTAAGWGADADKSNFWCPDAVFDARRNRVVLYFTNQGAAGGWGVATSSDGVHFTLHGLGLGSSQGGTAGGIDGNALLIDGDGQGYIAYSTIRPDAAGNRSGDHMVSIDRLAPDLLSSSQQQVGPVFPDSFVEGVMLFKRAGSYYLIYSSCCCCCTAGAGATVFRSANITGPWTRQPTDVNCLASVPICAGMVDPEHPERPTGQLVIPAQGFNVARLRGSASVDDDKSASYIWTGERWLSGAYAPNSSW